MQQFDIIIVGGGMVGAAVACALGDSELKVALLESHYPEPFSSEQQRDLRVSALSIASENLLRRIGAWSGIESRRLCPYSRMKVWESDQQNASTLFDASDAGCDHLGHIVENRIIQLALLDSAETFSNVTLLSPVTTKQINYHPENPSVELTDGRVLSAKLLVAADGGESKVRQAAGIGVHRWDYEQHAMVVSVKTAYPQQDITWQQFTPTGPLAFLPLDGQHASLVWYNQPNQVKRLRALTNTELLGAITKEFPECLGEITEIEQVGSFPLRRQHAQQYSIDGVVLVGDAAHMIHPLAGQGVNIGLLDASALAEVLLKAVEQNESIGSQQVLQRYEKMRRNNNLLMMQTMDLFYRIFSNSNRPLRFLRNAGLALAERLMPAKREVMLFAMGLKGDLPELSKRL